jgi:DNA-binding SARP family transcriptional activator/TolB-like protein
VPDRARLSLRIVGRLSLRVGESEVAALSRKSRALLGYLALTETGEETRERLVGLLWSEVPEDRARASLRQALHEIRDALSLAGFDGVTGDKQALRLDRSRVEVDLWDLFDRAAAGQPHPVLLQTERPIERLLDELDAVDPAFRVWLLAKRQALGDRLMRLMETAMRDRARPAADREGLARALRNLDPTHEEAARVLIGVRADASDIGGALNIYKALWDILDQEYDVEPSRETQELIAAIKLGRPAAEPVVARVEPPRPSEAPVQVDAKPPAATVILPAAPGATPVPVKRWPKLMVSVASFDGAATKPEHRYLVDGFRRELIACLVRFREWVVRDATLSAAAPASVADSAEYIVEASAFETGTDALRLVVTLRDLSTSVYLWSERLNVSVASWFESQQLVVRRITTALNVHVSVGRLVSLTPGHTQDLLAYDQWLRGQALFFDWHPTSWHTATDIFRDIIAKWPAFAPAYSSLAQLQNTIHFVHPGVFRTPERTDQALVYAREATQLDPIDSRAQLCLGWAYATASQHQRAAMHHELACELNENDPWTMVSAGLGFAFRGQLDKARAMADQALSLSLTPSAAHWRYQAMIRCICGDNEASVAAAERAGTSVPNVLVWKMAALVQLGRSEGAKAAAEEFFHIVQSRWFGQTSATREEISRWILHAFPIEPAEIWERLRDGLRHTGAPVDGLNHNQW